MAVAPHRILVIRALGLGDLLTAVPALRAIRRGYPDAQLTLAAPRWLAPLVRLVAGIDVLMDVSDLEQIPATDPDRLVPLRPASPGADDRPDRRFDLVVNLHGRGPQSVAAGQRCEPTELVTHAHPEFPGVPGPEWNDRLHEVDRWCRLVRSMGLAVDRGDLRLPVPHVAPAAEKAAVVHPGASAAARRWPPERFAAVAEALAAEGVRVLVTGTADEVHLAEWVIQAARHPWVDNVAGRLDLEQLAATVAAARLVVCGDTGVAHLASAYATPSVVLFGPTPPSSWGPPQHGPHRVIWRGHRGDPHGHRPDPGLLAISVDDALRASQEFVPSLGIGPSRPEDSAGASGGGCFGHPGLGR